MKEKNFLYLLVSLSRQIRHYVKLNTIDIPLTFEQIRAISYINHFEGTNLITLASLLETKAMMVTKITKYLEHENYILRKFDPNDKRSSMLYLTPKGKKICDKINNISQQAFKHFTHKLSNEELKLFELIMLKMQSNIEQNTP